LEVSLKVTIFAAAMIDRTECIKKLKACKSVVTDRFGVHSMRLFGSVARNEQNESSDVDICVEMEPSLLRRSGLKIYLEELLNCKVDVLRVHKNMDSYLTQQINRDGILIFK
jgi:predicted nucleotidyltransferase